MPTGDVRAHTAWVMQGVTGLDRATLEGSIFPIGSDEALPFDDCIAMIRDFFEHETEAQEAIPDGPQALRALSEQAQIVLLTNVPRHATESEISEQNLVDGTKIR